MGNVINFSNVFEYKIFEYVLNLLFLSECAILIFTYQGNHGEKKDRSDSGTVWLIMLGWIGSIILSIAFRSQSVPAFFRRLVLRHFVYYLGIVLIMIGIIVRGLAVWTLKKAFTHTVQTTNDQHLVQRGLYRFIRNPAYTGSILSLLGVAFAYRHMLAPVCVLIISLFCYSARIKVEEAALRSRFQEEFTDYCRKTKYRLFPYLF